MAEDKNLQKQYTDMKDNKKFIEKNPTYEKFCENINPNFKAQEQPPAAPPTKEGEANGGNTNGTEEKK